MTEETTTSLADYGDWSAEDANSELEEVKSASSSEFLVVPPDSKKKVRLLPPPPGIKSPFFVVWKHAYTDPESGKFIAFPCPKQLAGRRCQTCEESQALRRSAAQADQDLSWEMRAKKRVLVNLLDREDGKTKVWEIGAPMGKPKGKTLYEKLLKLRQDEDVGGNFVNPTNKGFDVIIQRTGKGKFNTSYEVFVDRHPSPLADDDEEALAICQGQPDLNWYITPPTPEQLQSILSGDGWGNKNREVDEGAGKRAALAASPTASSMVDDDYDPSGGDRPSF